MNKLKPSQKFCPSCGGKNPIRSFACKMCNHQYPQKPKPEKKGTIEIFLNKKRESEKKILSKYDVEIDHDITFLEIFMLNFCEKTKAKSTEKAMIKSKVELGTLVIPIEPNVCKPYACDFALIKSNKIFGVVLNVHEFKSFYLNCFEFVIKEQENQNSGDSKSPSNFELSVTNSSSLELNFKGNASYLRYFTKILPTSTMFVVSLENKIMTFFYLEGKIFQINDTHLNEDILMVDITLDTDNTLKIISFDCNNQIYLHQCDLNDKVNFPPPLNLISIYSRQFTSRITDLQFLNVSTNLKGPDGEKIGKKYFCASSRDGILKIFDTSSCDEVLFKYKSNQTWVTRFTYDSKTEFLFILTNLADKVIGVKFSSLKEPVIKRVCKTDNPIYVSYQSLCNKLFYLNNKGEIYSVDNVILDDMFKTYKSKKKDEYDPELFYKFEEGQEGPLLSFHLFNTILYKSYVYVLIQPSLDKIKLQAFIK